MKLTTVSDLRAWAQKRYATQHKKWLGGELDAFPLTVTLCELTEREFMLNQDQVRQFYLGWKAWAGVGTLSDTSWRWPRAGEQVLPTHITLNTPQDVAAVAGLLDEWTVARNRAHALNAITGRPPEVFAKLYDMLKGLSVGDWHHLRACVRYFVRNPDCGLYMRQLPIEGVDTKWVGLHVPELTKVLNLVHETDEDFYALTGVLKPDHLNHVVVRVLCPELRKLLSGLGHLDIPVAALKTWTLRPQKVLFVENLESGIALGDLPGTLAFVGKGNAVSALADIDWIARSQVFYWGDLDTHGLAIFGRLRAKLPSLVPVLMDVATFLACKALWVPEPSQHADVVALPPAQRAVFKLLTQVGATQGMRLEQERIPWESAWAAICEALD